MAETKRSLATVLANLADNTTQQIGAVDIRDAVVTVAPDFGSLYIVSSAATTITDTTSYFAAAGTYTLLGGSDWTEGGEGQLQYTGAATRSVIILAAFSLTTAANNQVLEIGIAKDGAIIPSSLVQRKTTTGSDVGAAAAFAFSTASTGDYFDLRIRNTSSASDATITFGQIGAIGLAA